jgi:hypothetical protein
MADGLEDEEVFWAAMSSWATLMPGKIGSPGTLYYPEEVSHVRQEYWDYLTCLDQHPKFAQESEFTQARMRSFSAALSNMTAPQSIKTLPLGDAQPWIQKAIEEAAFSRLHPIYDGLDHWEVYLAEHRSSAGTGSGGSAPG